MHLEHDSHQTGDRLPFGAAATGSSVFLRLRVLEGMNASLTAKVRLWTSGKGESYVPMEIEGTSFVAKVPMPQAATLLWYYLLLRMGKKSGIMAIMKRTWAVRDVFMRQNRRLIRLRSMTKIPTRRIGSKMPLSIRFFQTDSVEVQRPRRAPKGKLMRCYIRPGMINRTTAKTKTPERLCTMIFRGQLGGNSRKI